MICSRKIYKGEDAEVSIPFLVSGWTSLYVEYFTDGDTKVVRQEDELTIDEYTITAQFDGDDLGLLDDGVIYYTIHYVYDDENYIKSTNTPYVLCTPAGYSGKTEEEIYQEGYDAGLEACSGSPCDCTSAVTQAYNSGYTDGYSYGYDSGFDDGQEDCPNLQYQKNATLSVVGGTIIPDRGYDGMRRVSYNATPVYNSGYTSGYTNGYAQGQADCPECSGSSCNLMLGTYNLNSGDSGSWYFYPDEGYDGFGEVYIQDDGYGQEKYNQGYGDGFISGASTTDCSSAVTEAYELGHQSGYTDGYNSGSTDGYESGYTDGYAQGQEDCPECSGASCNLQVKSVEIYSPYDTYYPDEGYDGLSAITVSAMQWGEDMMNEGYASGYEDGLNVHCNLESIGYVIPAGSEGVIGLVRPSDVGSSAAGFSWFSIDATAYGAHQYQNGYDSGITQASETAYNSGYTNGFADGYLSGASTTDCSSAITESYNLGYSSGYTDGHESGYTEGFGDGHSSGYTDGFNSGYTSGYTKGYANGKTNAYKEGEQSVIKSFLAGNDIGINIGGAWGYDDYGYVVAYYYTSAAQECVITGYDRRCDERWDDAFSSMSVDGGPWVAPQLYYYLTEGWHQIRFNVKDKYVHYAFNHNFSPSGVCYMDALKAVSIPEASENQSGVTALNGTFCMNSGIRILSTSLKTYGGVGNGNALRGATNLNVIFSHYKGNENVVINSDVQSGVLFYPEGKSSTHSSTLSGWTKMELF